MKQSRQEILYDRSCKQVISNAKILARILKNVVTEAKDLPLNEIERRIKNVEVGDIEIDPTIEGMKKRVEDEAGIQVFDIRFYVDLPINGKEERIYVNVEIQNDTNVGYPLVSRGMSYASKLIQEQYGREYGPTTYGKMKKVYSIWIMPQATKEMDGVVRLFRMEEIIEDDQEPYEDKEDYDKIEVVMVYMYAKHDARERYSIYDDMLTPLTVLLTNNIESSSDKKKFLKENYDIDIEGRLAKEVDTMCNLSYGVMKQGEERGIVKDRMNIIKTLMNKGFTLLQIFDLLDFTDEEVKTYQNILMNE